MSYRRTRKRRRFQAFPDEEEPNVEGAVADQDLEDAPEGEPDNDATTEEVRKEMEIWDAFREEHYEAIEQLPLSLHRQYTLLLELDEQAQGYNKELLPTIHRYIKLRRALISPVPHEQSVTVTVATSSAPPRDGDVAPKSEPPATPIQNLSTPFNGNGSSIHHRRSEDHGTPIPLMKPPHLVSLAATRTPTPMSIPPERMKPPQTTQEMLSHIAWLSEEVLRASQEKVNLAQAAYDSVDRHIRLLDQSIKEQEASISHGVRPGTHLAPILLPEVIVPGSRPARPVQSSPIPNEADADGWGGLTLGMVGADGGEEIPARPRGRAGRRGRGKPRKDTEVDEVHAATRSRSRGGGTRASKASVPEEPPVAADEERYCYCNQVSFGEMVACDNEQCEREWFHLGCVGLDKPPGDDESWYCRDCQHLAKGTKMSRTRRRKRR